MGAEPTKGLKKQQGYRVLEIHEHSSFENKLTPFFDFIIAVRIDPDAKLPLQKPEEPKEINQTPEMIDRYQKRIKNIQEEEIKESKDEEAQVEESSKLNDVKESAKEEIKVEEEKEEEKDSSLAESNFSIADTQEFECLLKNIASPNIVLEVVDTKNRNSFTIKVRLESALITVRKEYYNEVFDTYLPIATLDENSELFRKGIAAGHYLIGCKEYAYASMDEFIEGIYEIYYDRQITNKIVHLVFYDLLTDTTQQIPIALEKKKKGLLGCEFKQGAVHRFPTDLQSLKNKLIAQKQQNIKRDSAIREIVESEGVAQKVADKIKKSKEKKYFKEIEQQISKNICKDNDNEYNINDKYESRIRALENKVKDIEKILEEKCLV